MSDEIAIREHVNYYVDVRQELTKITNAKKELESRAETSKEIILAHMEENGIVSLESDDGHIVFKSAKGYSEITDAESLKDWADAEGDEYVSARWELLNQAHKMKGVEQGIFVNKPNTKLCNVLVKDYMMLAETTGRDLADLLPPGLGTTLTPILSLRKPTRKAAPAKSSSTTLMELATLGAAMKENE